MGFTIVVVGALAADPFAPYAADPDHPWNRLHVALFERRTPDGQRHIHTDEPLLYRGGKELLEGEPHRRAVAELDRFLAGPVTETPARRLVLQRDLWAAFDHLAWYPDDWVYPTRLEPAAVALRGRLARAIGRLALTDAERAGLPDPYAAAVAARAFPPAFDPARPDRPFLPPDLFDPAGPWVRFHRTSAEPMAAEHFEAAGGRSAHLVFLSLPGGRAATLDYLKGLRGVPADRVPQFPAGTAVALVRRPLAVDAAGKVRPAPVTEQVQLRVYRRVPAGFAPPPPLHAAAGPDDQAVAEFVLDRPALFAGGHGLRAVGLDEPAGPLFQRTFDPFTRKPEPAPADGQPPPVLRQLQSCLGCHAGPGVRSVLSMRPTLAAPPPHSDPFRTYAWDVELSYTAKAKLKRFDWGLLQGLREGR